MKKILKSLLCVILAAFLSLSAAAEIISQPMQGREEITEKPIAEHPRLLFRADEIATIKANLKHSENAAAWNEYNKVKYILADGNLPESDEYNYDETVLRTLEANAFCYIIEGDRISGKNAYKGITNFMNTLNYNPSEGKGENYHDASHILFTAAEIYDWCYPLMEAEEKINFIEAGQRLMSILDWGYPVNLEENSMVTGAASSTMLLVDLFSFAIATYDENSDLYNYLSAVIKQKNMPARNYWYKSGKYMSGSSYGSLRAYSDSWLYWMLDNAIGVKFHNDSFLKLGDYILYEHMPDGKYLREGDENWHAFTQTHTDYDDTARFAVLNILSSLTGNKYYKQMADIMKPDFLSSLNSNKTTSFTYGYIPFTAVHYLIINDTSLEGTELSNLPNTKYFGPLDATMIAKTGWTRDAAVGDSPEAVAYMKIGGNQLYDHLHNDMGSFQLYYKGILMQDLGAYRRTDNPQYYAHNISTVSHNSLLIYDPLEYYKVKEPYVILKDKATDEYYDINVGGQKYISALKGHYDLSKYNEDLHDRADVTAYGFGPDQNQPEYSYISGDITKAYSDKARDVERSMMFMPTDIENAPAVFMVMDKITSENKYMDKKFLFQCVAEPDISGNAITVRRGTQDSRDIYKGELTSQILSPKNYKIESIGGPGKQWWVNGHNFIPQGYEDEDADVITTDRLDFGWGRIEISSNEENETEYFLNVMYMNEQGKFGTKENNDFEIQKAELIENEDLIGGKVLNAVTLFNKGTNKINSGTSFEIPGNDSYKVAVTGMDSGSWNVYENGTLRTTVMVTKESGVLYFEGNGGEYEIKKASMPIPEAEISYAEGNWILNIDTSAYEKVPTFKVVVSGNTMQTESGTLILPVNEEEAYTVSVTALSDGISPDSDVRILNLNTYYGGGEGIKENPYKISSKEHFLNIKHNKNAYYILTDNIELKENYLPFEFTGSFNGNGKSIKLNLELPAGSEVGLFSSLSEDSEIFDLNIFGKVTGYSYTGAIAGKSSATVKNCVNYADVTSVLNYAGGIAGYTNSNMNTVRNCTNYGEVKTLSSKYETACFAGGITGYNESPVILCGNYGNVSSGNCAGGITGASKDDIYGCFNNGNVTAEHTAGGVAGVSEANNLYKECYNSGKISGKTAAGIIGFKNAGGGKILRCYNIGEISTGTAILGGSKEGVSPLYQFADCYALLTSESGVAILSKTDFENPDKLNFDFENIWEYKNNGYSYPQLKYAEEKDPSLSPEWREEAVLESEFIETAQDFLNIINNPEGTYRLASDIDLTQGYEPFEFSGKLYGNGHTIKLNHNYPEKSYVGLFSKLSSGSVVSDVVIEGKVYGDSYIGGISGYTDGKILNCINYASVSTPSEDTYTGTRGGGITGLVSTYGGISGCVNYGDIKGRSSYFGGIAGVCNNGKIVFSENYGIVSTYLGGGAYGGIAGNSSNGVVENCLNTGNVKASGSTGGIVGQVSGSAALISDCFNTGEIRSNGKNAGGIAGQTPANGGTIARCYNIGKVFAVNTDYSSEKAIFGEVISDAKTVNISDCFYLESLENQPGNFGTPLSEAELKEEKSFAPFDFESIWNIETKGYYYPKLNFALLDADYCYNPYEIELPVLYEQFEGDVSVLTLSDNLWFESPNIRLKNRLSLVNKYVILSYGSVSGENADCVLKKCGIVISEDEKFPAVGKNGCVDGCSNTLSETFGIMFGGNLDKESSYYIRPYAVYEYNGNIYTLYGNVGTAVPTLITF